MASSSSVKNITVLSSDCDEFEMTVGAAMQSELLKGMLEACSVIGKVPLFEVTTPVLAKVMEYCQKHADYEAANGGRASAAAAAAELKAWDAEFVKKEELDMVLDILMAASDLNIQGLVDLCYETMADMIKERSLEQIQQIFGKEKNDALALQEQEQIRKQN